jgi:hypothetical protein
LFAGAWQDPQKPAPAGELATGKIDPALLRQLTWICGTWAQQQGQTTIEESWRPLQGTTIPRTA